MWSSLSLWCCFLCRVFSAGKPLRSAAMWAERRRPRKTFVHLEANAERRWSVSVNVHTVLGCLQVWRNTVAATVQVPSDLVDNWSQSICPSLDQMIPPIGDEALWQLYITWETAVLVREEFLWGFFEILTCGGWKRWLYQLNLPHLQINHDPPWNWRFFLSNVCSSHASPACLTQFVFSRVVRDLHDVELQACVALPDAVDAGDVRTRLVHRLHQLGNVNTVY